jgi:hypothetical protein
MTTPKAGTRKIRKAAPQTASRYRTVRVIKKTRKHLADKIEGYNDRYIQKPIRSSRTFIKDLNADPRKTIEKLADDSREQLADVRRDTRKKVDDYLKDGRKFYRRARKNPRKTLEGVVKDFRTEAGDRVKDLLQDGRKIAEIVEKDGRMVVDRLQSAGKETFDKHFGRGKSAKTEPVLIKKYVNGRFYDTVNKKYLKKDDLARLVKEGANLRIIYTKTGRNITRMVLSGLTVEPQSDKKAFLLLDEVTDRLKENQERIREAVDRRVDSVRKAIKISA